MALSSHALFARTVRAPTTWTWRDALALAKPRLSSLVVITAAGGAAVAPQLNTPFRVLVGLAALALVVGAANAFNCHYERTTDALMPRTAQRPLAAGRMQPTHGLLLALLAAIVGLLGVMWAGGLISTALAATGLASYAWVYTPLKRRSSWAMVVGTVPGALPPMIGWALASGQLATPAWSLFAWLTLWQLPHFMAIALMQHEHYGRAGIRTVIDALGMTGTCQAIRITQWALLPCSMWMASTLAAPAAAWLALGGAWLLLAPWRAPRPHAAGKVLAGTICYLSTALLALAGCATYFK